MQRRKLSYTMRFVLVFGILLFVANAVLGVVVLRQSSEAMKALIHKNMLDVVETASGILDGDTLGALTAADVDGETYRSIEDKLLVFLHHSDIRFIYGVKQADERKFVFIVDPDPEEPAAFGEEIVLTDGLIQAGGGVSAVDDAPMADRWGNFYSAFSPVFDSAGRVACIVGIDFDADWYEGQLRRYMLSIVVVTLFSVLLGGVVVFTIAYKIRKRFGMLDGELSELSASVEQLMKDVDGAPDGSAIGAGAPVDEIEKLAGRIRAMRRDVAVYERLQREQLFTDAVTGIPNLNYLKQFADERVNRLWADGAEPAVIYFDVRSMAAYNTEYGYDRGDALLRLTAQTVQAAFPGALAGRGEGDHFIVVDGYDDSIPDRAAQINDAVRRAAYGRTTGVQCGVARMTRDMKAVEAIQRARSVLKRIGDDLNVVCRTYSQEDDEGQLSAQYVAQHFEEALQNGWIRVFYQPILRTRTRKITALEALARWVDPARGMISPGVFIPARSRYHLLHRLDLGMVEQICRESLLRREAGLPQIPVSVNFSAQDFDYVDVPEALNGLLERYGLPRSSIIVEITEQDLARATEHFKGQLRRIRECGYQLWIDDFGSGYSSLNVFSQYQVDRIKFDMDLVRHLDDNGGANRIIMRSVVDMCRRMGVHTLAEGVETWEQYQFLSDIDCELVQGFLFYKPEPVEAAVGNLQRLGPVIPHETDGERLEQGEQWMKGNYSVFD